MTIVHGPGGYEGSQKNLDPLYFVPENYLESWARWTISNPIYMYYVGITQK